MIASISKGVITMEVAPKRYGGEFLRCLRAAEYHREGHQLPVDRIVAAYRAIDPGFVQLRDSIHAIRSINPLRKGVVE